MRCACPAWVSDDDDEITRVPAPISDPRNASAVQKESSAVLSGRSTGPASRKPARALSRCTAVFRMSGSTTTRRAGERPIIGTAKAVEQMAPMTAAVVPGTGVRVGATRRCMPKSPGSCGYRPSSSTSAGS